MAALLGQEGSGGHELAGMAFLCQAISGIKLRKGSDNQHVVGVCVW